MFSAGTFALDSTLIDDSTEKVAWVGRVWNKDRATKSITKVHFLTGAITSAGGSGAVLSLQNVSLTASPYQPDETQDQTVAFLLSALTANAWNTTAALSAARSVAFGELLAVVIEYDVGGRLGSDALNVRNLRNISGHQVDFNCGVVLKTGGTWAVQTVVPNVLLEFTDGTFGTLQSGYPISSRGEFSIGSGSTPDEVGLKFTIEGKVWIDGVWMNVATGAAGRDFDVVLYDAADNVLATVSCDGDVVRVVGTTPSNFELPFGSEIELTAGATYRLTVKPTTTGAISFNYSDVAASGHLQAHAGGTSWIMTQRIDAGAWTDTATRRPFMGLLLSAFDDGVGGGAGSGAVIIHRPVYRGR